MDELQISLLHAPCVLRVKEQDATLAKTFTAMNGKKKLFSSIEDELTFYSVHKEGGGHEIHTEAGAGRGCST
eukprot:1159855-Pelagomonas_calceolata.AAC.1